MASGFSQLSNVTKITGNPDLNSELELGDQKLPSFAAIHGPLAPPKYADRARYLYVKTLRVSI